MKTVILVAVGFFLGVSYSNGTLGDFGDITRNLVNSAAQQIAEATEPSTADLIEQKIQQTVDTVSQ